jgi:putative ABC transport system permease protein
MFKLMLQKVLHKKWMAVSLIIGYILFIAIAVSYPMYKDASLKRMLEDEFSDYLSENNVNPALLHLTGRVRRASGTADYENMKTLSVEALKKIGLTPEQTVKHSALLISNAVPEVPVDDDSAAKKIIIGSLENMPDHARVVSGSMYSGTIDDEGYMEAVVTTAGLVDMDLLVGEKFEFENLHDTEGNAFKVKITGVITNSEQYDNYWTESPDTFNNEILIDYNLFESTFMSSKGTYEYNTDWYCMFDYDSINVSDVPSIVKGTNGIIDGCTSIYGKAEKPEYLSLLDTFQAKQKKIGVTLLILDVPVMLLLCAFIFMISGKMIDMEQAEIALMQSRGSSRWQVFSLYLMQSVILSTVSFIAALPVAAFLCKSIGSADAFLEFVRRRPLNIRLTGNVLLYGATAALACIVTSIMPAVNRSGISIVKQKQNKARTTANRPLWQKMFADVLIFSISLYGYYSFNSRRPELVKSVMEGSALDPLLFFSSSLFILGAGLMALRLKPVIVKLIFNIRKKYLSPAMFASYLEIMRSGSSQYFIMTFMIITVALGIFNTTVARTILSNAENNIRYNNGASLVIQEFWPSNEALVKMDPSVPLVYTEPDYGKYGEIDGVTSMAQVYVNSDVTFKGLDKDKYTATVMGINTKDFGETAIMPEGLLPEHFYDYLNAMSSDASNVIVSSNFRDKQGYRLGDTINYSDKDYVTITGKIVAFVDYWPSYCAVSGGLNPDGSAYTSDNYLIVSHLSSVQDAFGVTPYQVWFNMADTDPFYDFVEKNNVKLLSYKDTSSDIVDIKNDTLFQGTNGILTMSFIIILVLCAAGYLIYWLISIKSRELLFGVLRAMGMSKKEILSMLINEQIYSGLFSIICGTLIGAVSAKLFVPMLQIAYSAADQSLPMEMVTKAPDMVRLFGVIIAVLAACIGVLAKQIYNMKITQALKLGED